MCQLTERCKHNACCYFHEVVDAQRVADCQSPEQLQPSRSHTKLSVQKSQTVDAMFASQTKPQLGAKDCLNPHKTFTITSTFTDDISATTKQGKVHSFECWIHQVFS